MVGIYNSSLTRVKPLFDSIRNKDNYLNLFLSAFNKDFVINESIQSIFYGDNEIKISPSLSLLRYLVINSHILNKGALGNDDGSDTYKKRMMLLNGNSYIKNDALEKLEMENIPQKEWYIFEGYTQPDIYIETQSYILIGEGKRTEQSFTTSTKWLTKRDQLIRHIDSVLDRNKVILSFFVVDRAVSKSKNYLNQIPRYDDLSYYKENLSHRSQKEIEKAMSSFIGIAYWDQFEDIFDITFPDTI